MALVYPGWYVLYTKPNHEKKVTASLNDRNIRCYLPLKRSLRKMGNRRKIVDTPLFPSYVFIYLEELQHYYSGLDLEGVLNYVRIGRDIARVQDQVVDDICLTVNGAEHLEVSAEYFPPGTKLMINEGPLTGLACEVVHYEDKKRYLVRVKFMNRCILITAAASGLLANSMIP
jgi:transcriptional antiterminator RfaH